jgi:hypothetical protein
MARKLKVWNGRPVGILPTSQWKRGGETAHVYACAYSVADLQNLCDELGLHRVPASEVRVYWSPLWGRQMGGIAPERGIWIAYGYTGKPERIVCPTPEAKDGP